MVSTKQSILGGERTNLDALNAEKQLFTTRRDLAQARYDYLMAWTKLHYYAGTLNEQDLARVDESFGQAQKLDNTEDQRSQPSQLLHRAGK